MKFLHFADAHLGNKMYGLDERYNDFFRNFEYILDFANKEKVDFILCAGDLFDSRQVNAQCLHDAVKILKKYPSIPCLVCSGNHDRATFRGMSWLEYLDKELDNFTFVDGMVDFSEKVRIYGFEGTTKMNRYIEEHGIKRSDTTILMLHCMIIGQLPIAHGINIDETRYKDFDYVALGHCHKPYSFPKPEKIYNPGSVERTKIDEEGGGFYIWKDGKVKFHELEKRGVERVVVDVSPARSTNEISTMVDTKIGDVSKESIVEVTLMGKSSLNPDIGLMQEKLNRKLFYVKFRNHVVPPEVGSIDEDKGDVEVQVLGEFLEKGDVEKVLELKRLVHAKPSPEEMREILK